MNADGDESHLRTKNIIYLKGIVHHHKITIMLLLTHSYMVSNLYNFILGRASPHFSRRFDITKGLTAGLQSPFSLTIQLISNRSTQTNELACGNRSTV